MQMVYISQSLENDQSCLISSLYELDLLITIDAMALLGFRLGEKVSLCGKAENLI
jgi:hypothetical protein